MTMPEKRLAIGAVQPPTTPEGRFEETFQQFLETTPANAEMLFALGMIAFRDGRLDAAISAISKALALDNTNADYHYYHGGAHLGLGRLEEATMGFQRALELRPEFPEAHNDLGNVLASRGQLDAATAHYRKAVLARPEFAEACFNLGVALGRQGKWDEAMEAYRQALAANPQLATAAKHLASLCAKRNKLGDAVDAYRHVLKTVPDAETHNDLGIILARLGRHDEAAASYRAALRLRPEYPDAHNNLGNALRNKGKLDEAIACFREALKRRAVYPEAHNNLGIALKHKGKHEDAIQSYQEALRLRPDYPEAHNNLGIALATSGKHEAAVISFRQAVRLKPEYVEALCNLGNALSDLRRLGEAVEAYDRALRVRPRDPKIHKAKGIALVRQEKYKDAIACYQEALRLRPEYPEVHNDLGIALARQSKYEDAVASYRKALEYRPEYAEAHNNMGNALRNMSQFEDSLECYRTAIRIKPRYTDAYNNQGITFSEMGRFDDAVASYTECIRLNPNHIDAHMNRALTWLRKGNYAQGWAEYEWRWRKRKLTNRPLIMPLWNGFPLNGRRILLITEQGNGDTIQFIRFARLLKEQGGTVILECPERLLKLLANCPHIDHLVAQGQPLPDYDVFAPMLTLPGLLGTALDKIPAEVPYLAPDPELLEKWRRELADVKEFKVGINWQGNPKYAGDRHRSIPLRHFEPLSKVPGVRLFSIQKNFGSEQLKDATFEVTDLGSRLDNETGPFLDTAAVMKNLDLFITSDTAVAHLAGALGVPVWMAVSTTPDWRWLTIREDNPWYPTMRIFRQSEHMVWPPVFERIAAELRKLVPATPEVRAVNIEVAPGELIDKITILQIKSERIEDPAKLQHVHAELASLSAARDRVIVPSDELLALTAELKSVNEALWVIEDDIRACDRNNDFGPRFVALAQSVYRSNDRRAALKRRINLLLKAEVVEEKSYAPHSASGSEAPPDDSPAVLPYQAAVAS